VVFGLRNSTLPASMLEPLSSTRTRGALRAGGVPAARIDRGRCVMIGVAGEIPLTPIDVTVE
jgi:hypothetical protein